MELLQLPQEIRLKIWRGLVTRTCPVDAEFESIRLKHRHASKPCHPRSARQFGCRYLTLLHHWRDGEEYEALSSCRGHGFSVNLLRTCRSIYSEAHKLLYKENIFILRYSGPYWPNSSSLSLMTSIHLELETDGYYREPMLYCFRVYSWLRELRQAKFPRNVRLTVISPTESRDIMDAIFDALEKAIDTVESFSCSIGPPLYHSINHDFGKKIMSSRSKPQRTFHRYSDLPLEIRLLILSFTGIAGGYRVRNGRFTKRLNCCRNCCSSLQTCCCGPLRFSSTCSCSVLALNFMSVSRTFALEANRVLLQGHLIFRGHLRKTLSFLHRQQPEQSVLRSLEFRIGWEDYCEWEEGNLPWQEFLDLIEMYCHSKLCISITITYCHGMRRQYRDPQRYRWSDPKARLRYVESYKKQRKAMAFYDHLKPGLMKLSRMSFKNITFNARSSSFPIPWTRRYIEDVRAANPRSKYLGGQWEGSQSDFTSLSAASQSEYDQIWSSESE